MNRLALGRPTHCGRWGPSRKKPSPLLLRRLTDEKAGKNAAEALAEIGPPARAAVPALVKAMNVSNKHALRLCAVKAVGRIGAEAREAIPSLIIALEGEGSGYVSPAAVDALVQIGPVAVPALIKALRESKPAVRQAASEALGRLGPAAKAAVPALSEALKDSDFFVRAAAAFALWRIDGQTEAARSAISALVALLEKQTPHDREIYRVVNVLRGTGPLLPQTAAPGLVKTLENWSRAPEVLVDMGVEAVPALIVALDDGKEYVRISAISTLGQLGPVASEAVPALTRALTDAKADVRTRAAFALARMGKHARPAIPALGRNLDDPNPIVRWASFAAVRALGTDAVAAVPALGRVARNPRSRVWDDRSSNFQNSRILEYLADSVKGNADAAPVLAAFQRSKPTSDSELAIQILADLGPAARDAVPSLLVACHDERVTVRRAALAALKKVDPQALARVQPSAKQCEALWDDLASSDEVKAFQAVWTFALAPEQALPWLTERLHPVSTPDAARVARLIRDLDDDEFFIRDEAEKELAKLGELAAPALKTALGDKPSLHVRTTLERFLQRVEYESPAPEQLQALRSVSVLEKMGTPEARASLVLLAKGAAGAGLTRKAKGCLGTVVADTGEVKFAPR